MRGSEREEMTETEPPKGRAHRPITGLSGVVLFVCLFLPAVRVCGREPDLPLEYPLFDAPYVHGLAFAIYAVVANSRRGVIAGVTVLRIVSALTVLGAVVLTILTLEPVCLIVVGLESAAFAILGIRGASERRAGWQVIAVASASALWFGLWLGSPDSVYGIYVSFAAAIGLLFGGLVWIYELRPKPPKPAELPRAIARSV